MSKEISNKRGTQSINEALYVASRKTEDYVASPIYLFEPPARLTVFGLFA